MSVFLDEIVTCPHCEATEVRSVARSVNAERSPDLREAVLAGTFQQVTCGKCGGAFEIGAPFLYVDAARGQWIAVHGRTDAVHWESLEQEASDAWHRSTTPHAPWREARVRAVFGLLALREKLVCDDLGLDDAALEVLKLQISVAKDLPSVTAETELRLYAADDEKLYLLVGTSGAEDEDAEDATFLHVPRAHYARAADEPWRKVAARLSEGPFVDARRILLDGDWPAL